MKNLIKNLKIKALAIVAITILISCSKSADDQPQPSGPQAGSVKDVYIAGYAVNSSSGKTMATYWKNGVAINLTDGTNTAELSDIEVIDNDVYACGYESNGTIDIPKYWKNGTAIALGTLNGKAKCMTSSGDDIFIGGKKGNYAVYWVSGVTEPVILGTSSDCFVTDIKVIGNDIYCGGGKSDRAGFWKNDDNFISISNNSSGITAFQFVGAIKYASGGNDGSVGYWKNTTFKNAPSANDAFVSGISVNKSVIYTCGHENNGTLPIAKYWKNAEATVLSTKYSAAFDLIFANNDVYTCGVEQNASVLNAVYWKNGTVTQLSTVNSVAVKIFLTYN